MPTLAARNIKSLAYRCVTAIGLPQALQRTMLPASVSILMYHAVVREPLRVGDWCFVDEAEFRQQLEYLARRFEVLPLAEAVRRLRKGMIRKPTAAISFDDGFQNNHDVALPILRELGLPAAIFLATGFIGCGATLWFCHLNRALAETKKSALRWRGATYDLSSPAAREAASQELQAAMKELEHETLLAETRSIVEQLGSNPDWTADRDSPYRMLDAAAVRGMAASGLVEFGAHTVEHTILTRVGEPRARQEIARSMEATAALSGRPCRLFAYPNGRRQDYNAAAIEALEAAGIEAAVTTIQGPNTPEVAPLELKRIGVGADLRMPAFQMLAHHTLSILGVRPS